MTSADQVADDERLLRRIHPTFVKPDGTISSQAFTDPETSVDREALLPSPNPALARWPGYGLAALVTGEVRQLGLEVRPDPLEQNPAHALIVGKKTKAIARQLARSASWVRRV